MAAILAPMSRADSPDANDPSQKIYEQTVNSFVMVSYHLKKSDRPHLDGDESQFGQQSILQGILNKNTLDTVGVIVSDKGEVFTVEREPVHWEVIDHITIKGVDGAVMPAKVDRLLVKAPGRILRIEGNLPAGWKPLSFAECDRITPQTKLFSAALGSDRYHRLYIKPCDYGRNWDAGVGCGDCLRVSSTPLATVLCNEDGCPVGVTCDTEIDLGPGGPLWRGKDILADPGVTDEQCRRLQQKMEKEFAENLYEVRIMPRLDSEDDEESDYGRRFRFGGRFSDSETDREILKFALGIAENKLLIPEALSKELVAGIDTIAVRVGDQDVPARFGGVLKDCAATVIELPEGKLPHVAAFSADGRLARVEPFWAVYAREMGGKDVRTEFTRWIDKQQGYADLWYPTVERSIPAGSWLVDRDGNLVGFYGDSRHENDRLEPHLLGMDEDRYRSFGPAMMRSQMAAMMGSSRPYGYAGNTRLIDAAEMARTLADLPANYDPLVKHLAKDEQKRRVWLGVEYTAPDKEMIKQMGLRQPTQDGRIGLMVNRVYEGSPAEQMGLAEGDVLLKIAAPGAPWPIELHADEQEEYDGPDFDEADVPKEFAAMGYQMPRRRPWPSQENYLTNLLA
ncbi:MAG: hypothetical protein ABFE01_26985, partial [Phycisphaerales bacterium]